MSAVSAAVSSLTGDSRVATAMLLGALLEGGSLDGPWPPGDQGTSFGPWQIHLPAHPGVTQADAENPLTAALFMLPSYTQAVQRIPDANWQSDPMGSAAEAVYLAERPAAMYPPARVAAAWAALKGGGSLPVGGGGAPGGTGVVPAGYQFSPLDAPQPGDTYVGPVDVSGVARDAVKGFVAQLLGPLTPANLGRFGVAVIGVVAVGVGAYVIFS